MSMLRSPICAGVRRTKTGTRTTHLSQHRKKLQGPKFIRYLLSSHIGSFSRHRGSSSPIGTERIPTAPPSEAKPGYKPLLCACPGFAPDRRPQTSQDDPNYTYKRQSGTSPQRPPPDRRCGLGRDGNRGFGESTRPVPSQTGGEAPLSREETQPRDQNQNRQA